MRSPSDGNSSCIQGAEIIHDELKQHCDHVEKEYFTTHPDAFLGFFRVWVTNYICGTAALVLTLILPGYLIYVALAFYTIMVTNAIAQFVYYKEWFDPFYKKATCINVVGVIEPAGEVKQQIIIGGHHDSAYVFSFLERWQKYYSVRIILGIVTGIVVWVVTILWGLLNLFTGNPPFFAFFFPYVAVVALIFVLPLFRFVGKQATPGAGDNLIASVMGIKLAQKFGNARKNNEFTLKNTRLVIVSNDAEESGVRGARAYVKKHKDELHAIPSYFFNVDSVYNLEDLKTMTSDVNGSMKLSTNMAIKCSEIAKELGYKMDIVPITFGGGATDASEFAREGIDATTIIALPFELVHEGMVYHTLADTVDKIPPETVEAIMKIAVRYILKKDSAIQTWENF